MALFQQFQKRDQLFHIAHEKPAISQQQESLIRLIVGLGNVGDKYSGTRHNIGFDVVDAFHKKHNFPAWSEKTKFKALISEDYVNGQKVILAKPTTYMNLSGEAIQQIKSFYTLDNNDILVIHDELDLPFGTVKEKKGGGSAGNNGLKSIIGSIGEDFKRLRIGIRNELADKIDAADFVLAKFSSDEKKQLGDIIQAAITTL